MGVELRRIASLEIPDEIPDNVAAQTWATKAVRQGAVQTWWRKGWETMRIPRFAFAAMVAGILVLASGLALTRVRARSEGSVLLLRLAMPGSDQPVQCPLSTVDKRWQSCGESQVKGDRWYSFDVRLLSSNNGRVRLGTRAASLPLNEGNKLSSALEQQTQHVYEFSPEEPLNVDVENFGSIQITGEWMDHMPQLVGVQEVDPGPNEMRVVAPLLIRDKQVVADFQGASAFPDKPGMVVMLNAPGEGKFLFSLTRMPDAVEGKVNLNRITFASNGQHYTLLSGAPITRAQQVWIRHDAWLVSDSKGNAPQGFIMSVYNMNNAPAGLK
ncbi:MAG: hypothetical protein QM649_16995 [Silvibacterium sp.]